MRNEKRGQVNVLLQLFAILLPPQNGQLFSGLICCQFVALFGRQFWCGRYAKALSDFQ